MLSTARLRRWSRMLPRIGAHESRLARCSDEELCKESRSLQWRSRSGESPVRLLPEACALVRIAGKRALGMRHFDEQILGGIAMYYGCVAEMQTGEGKTLAATLPLYLAALLGRGAHLATANDYLAQRDAEWMGPLYALLGVSVGVVTSSKPPPERRRAYQCDITYGTAKEFGFDFLRDRLAARRLGASASGPQGFSTLTGGSGDDSTSHLLQRELFMVVVDEADSVLIDEARTPLVVSESRGPSPESAAAAYRWAAASAPRLEESAHYEYDARERQVALTAEGRRLVRELAQSPELAPSRELAQLAAHDLFEHVERAIKVNREMVRDRHYVVRGKEVVIVDEFTGRLSEGRKWRGGIHQAVEARENLPISPETGHAAQVTIQNFFRRYERLAGMTGTATGSEGELRRTYRLGVVSIPTHRPSRRTQLPDAVFGTGESRWQAVVDEVRRMHDVGRPVLVGTRSIDKSEYLSRLLTAAGIEHQVLNARQLASEADIIAQAGQAGKVTVATNMAGRGTDIQLGPGVEEQGGLHVIATELHEARRIDRQLIGRAARQGDAGSYRQFMALDDEILSIGLGPETAERWREFGSKGEGPFDDRAGLFRRAQARVEREHRRQRRLLLEHEQRRAKLHQQLGQDPYLDSPE